MCTHVHEKQLTVEYFFRKCPITSKMNRLKKDLENVTHLSDVVKREDGGL